MTACRCSLASRSMRPAAGGIVVSSETMKREVEIEQGEEAIAPGQACVIYETGADTRAAAAVPRRRRNPRERGSTRPRRASRSAPPSDRSADGRHRQEYGREGLCALGRRSTISFSARCSMAGRKATIAAAEKIGGRILDVGVGTGNFRCQITGATSALVGVDYSAPMLKKAHERVVALKLTNVESAGGDGREASSAFATSSSMRWWRNMSSPRCRSPKATLDEFVAPWVKPGGEIILINHIGAEQGPRRLFRAMLRRRWRAGSAGGRNFRGSASRPWGRAVMAASS